MENNNQKKIVDKDYNIVFIINNYWNGPLEGVASFNGTPHVFQRIFDEDSDNWSNRFYLKPIDQGEFDIVMEGWEIWKKWITKFKLNKVILDSQTCLPEDEKRYKEILTHWKTIFEIDLDENHIAIGEFKYINSDSNDEWPYVVRRENALQVKWITLRNEK